MTTKLQRWIDLLAGLLAHSFPVSFEELARIVPEYQHKLAAALAEPDPTRRERLLDALKRSFERDKDELRAFGVPIESLPDDDGNPGGRYRLRRKDFYLPYLCVAAPEGGAAGPARVDRYGYQALSTLSFEPDELQAVVDSAALVRTLGDPLLAAESASALRKLAVDLPLDAVAGSADLPKTLLPRAQAEPRAFEVLSESLARRKRVSFSYHSMSSDATAQRDVEPFGLFFLHGHWYLAARDRAREGLRNFRLNRIADPVANRERPQTPDYEIPQGFRLAEHAASRQAWELGLGEVLQAIVELRGSSGPALAAVKLGATVAGHLERRAFQVRRRDVFARWLLSFAGELIPLGPAEVVELFWGEVERTAALYARDVTEHPVPVSVPASDSPVARRWSPDKAAAQLRRILNLVPRIADGEEHALGEVAGQLGTDVATLRNDLYSLVERYYLPAGFVEGVQLFVEADRVSARPPNHFLRPMRLTAAELCALELGLAVLRQQRPPDEHRVLESARERLREVIAKLPGDPLPEGLTSASLGEPGDLAVLCTVRAAIRERKQLRIRYRKSGSGEASDRVVCPRALVAASGMFYLLTQGEQGIRVFRMDRVEAAELLREGFEPADGFTLDQVLEAGRVFIPAGEPELMRVRYSPRVARWIAEREGRTPAADGSLVMEYPLGDREWGIRHVLQYGAEAEVVGPVGMRSSIRKRLSELRPS